VERDHDPWARYLFKRRRETRFEVLFEKVVVFFTIRCSDGEERTMKLLFMKVPMTALMLAGVFAATPVFAGHVLDFQVFGKGSVVSDCALATLVNCTIELNGQARGTYIDDDERTAL
jgi:hypothetical protein